MSKHESAVVFDNMIFLNLKKSKCTEHHDFMNECYKVTSSLNDTTVEMSMTCGGWDYTYPNCYRPRFHNLTNPSLDILKVKLIERVQLAKETYFQAVFKNLNLVRDRLHRDIIPQIVMMLSDLRHVHYLETKI